MTWPQGWSTGDGRRVLHAPLPPVGALLYGPVNGRGGHHSLFSDGPPTVYRLLGTRPLPAADWTVAEREAWRDAGRPLDWPGRPVALWLAPQPPDGETVVETYRPLGRRYGVWHVVNEHRPVCAVCGGPYPCGHLLAEIADDRATERHEKLIAVAAAGHCWACREEITERQKWISYPGPNLDLGDAPAPRFHAGRRACGHAALKYEKRWVRQHPGRRGIRHLDCPGWLITHRDGSQSCTSPSCPGTDAGHARHTACYAGELPANKLGAGPQLDGPCPRGCPRTGHPGAFPPNAQRRPRRPKAKEEPVYVVPAAFPLISVHVQDLARGASLRKPVQRGRRVAEWPKETVLGWTLCNMPMYAEALWVAYGYDPDRDSKSLLCPGCGGPPRAEAIAMF